MEVDDRLKQRLVRTAILAGRIGDALIFIRDVGVLVDLSTLRRVVQYEQLIWTVRNRIKCDQSGVDPRPLIKARVLEKTGADAVDVGNIGGVRFFLLKFPSDEESLVFRLQLDYQWKSVCKDLAL